MEAATALTPDEQRKKRQAVGQPAAPAAITDGIVTTPNPRPKTILIGGIPHLDLGDQQKYPGPISMAADAVAGTVGYIANAPFDRSSRLDANRAGLDSSSEVAAEQQRQAATAKPQAVTAAASQATTPIGIASMTPEQRFKAADAYGNAVDKATGVSSSGAQGITGMAKRFDTYAKNPDVLAMRNAREELLGSDIQFETGPDGRLRISNSGSHPQAVATSAQAAGQAIGQASSQQPAQVGMLPAAQGTPMDMRGLNDIMARENRTRGDMIDSMIKANGGNGVAVLGGDGQTAEDKINAERTQRWAIDDMANRMKSAGTRTERAAFGQAMQSMVSGQNQINHEQLRQQGIAAGHSVQMRGQDIMATNDANKLALDQQRLSIDAPYRQAQTTGQEQQNRSASTIADLQQRARTGDAKAIETLRAINGKGIQATDRFMAVQGGEEIGPDGMTKIKRPGGVFDAQTGRFVEMNPQQGGPGKFSKADVESALAKGADKAKIAERIKAMGGNPADYGL